MRPLTRAFALAWFPVFMIALGVGAAVAGPNVTGSGNFVYRSGDTMTGTLTINVTDGQTALSIDEGDRLYLNGGVNSYYFEAASGTLALVISGGSQFTFDQVMSFSRITGNNAISFQNDGARFDLGSGSTDYLDSDGTNIQTGGDLDIGGNGLNGVETTSTFAIASSTADSTTSATVAAVTLSATADITNTDLLARATNSAGSVRWGVTEEGDMGVFNSTAGVGIEAAAGSGFFSGSAVTRAWCRWRFQEGQTTTLTDGCAAFTETNGAARAANTTDTTRYYANLVTSTVDGNQSNMLTAVETLFSRNPRFSTAVRTGSSVSNIILWAGMTEADVSGVTTLAGLNTIDSAIFRFDTNLGDVNWMCCSSDGTTASCASSGIAVNASTSYKMSIHPITAGGASWRFFLGDVQVCQKENNPPGSTQNVRGQIVVRNISGGAAKVLGMGAGALEVP